LKTALIHEWLSTIGGSEKSLEAIYEVFPSPIYTLVADKNKLKSTSFKEAEIRTSFIQKLPFAKRKYRSYLGLFPLAVEQFDLSDYDVILSSSHCAAKGVLTRGDQLHICYCYSPMRYAWDLYHNYLTQANLSRGLKSLIARKILHKMRIWDVISSNRVNYFIAISHHIAKRIKKIYNRESVVIYPPVDIGRFEVQSEKENFYVTASRLVPYKMISLIVKAFAQMPDKKLVVIGDGPEFMKIKQYAANNIEIMGYQPFTVLKDYLGRAKAFVFAAEEDFGILPVEAQACGTPVIAYGKGGALETIIPGKSGLFFNRQDEESLIDAVGKFETLEGRFHPHSIRKSIEKFSRDRFKKEIRIFVADKTSHFFS
jgi:glycosyltransferase involved in cell wall biosynthesis